MPIDEEAAKRLLAMIDTEELAQLACDLVNIPSPTGQERDVAEFTLNWLRANGLKAIRQEVEKDRPNAVGIMKGQGRGLSLMFNGHLDTGFTLTEEDLLMVSELEPEVELRASVRDGRIYGHGISNMKGGLAAFMIASKAIKKSGLRLKGDVILAGVVGEISRVPIGRWQTREYRGEGVGTRHLLTHGIHSDYAIVADGSDLRIVWTQAGVVDFKITTFGDWAPAWGTKRSTHPPEKVNAIIKMTKIIDALERWAEKFEERFVYSSPTGPILPKVNIGAIEGGAPFRPNHFPGTCSLYVDVRIPPDLKPPAVQCEVERALSSLGFEYDVEAYRSQLGYEGKGVEPLVSSLKEIYQYLFSEELKPEVPERASIWTDTNIYNEMGIPAVKIGPRGKHRMPGPRGEVIDIRDLVKAAQIYAFIAVDICSRERR